MKIRATDLAVSYGKIDALAIDRLVLGPGQLYVLTGPNGSGKSTLLHVVAGLLAPTSGKVHIGRALPGSLEARREVSFVPDLPALFDDLTLDDQLHYVARLHKHKSLPTVCVDLMDRLQAEDLLIKFPRSMSKGQRQKAALLVAAARPFSVFLLDEPTTGLDADSKTSLIDGLVALADAGVTVVASTHDDELINAAHDHIRLVGGRLLAEADDTEEE